MVFTVDEVLKEPALVVSGSPGLTIQTGTILLSQSAVEAVDDWNRGRVDQPVFDLPQSAQRHIVQVSATAAPASIGYWPHGLDLSPSDLHAAGRVGSGHADLKVISMTGIPPALPAAGWAVDRTQAIHDLNVVRLVVDLAVWGPTTIMRIAYSLFIVTSPFATTTATKRTFPQIGS